MSVLEAWDYLEGVLGELWKLPAVSSVLGLFILVGAYGLLYWLYLVYTGAYFIEISPFRIWRDPTPSYLPQGLTARLVDELMRLQQEVRAHGLPEESGESEGATGEPRFHQISLLPPVAAQVTIEYKGISPEALNAFLRRVFRRHVLITCDAIPVGGRLRLLGRSAEAGPWEVDAPPIHGTGAFGKALQEFAVKAVGEVRPSSRKALANALAYRQREAFRSEDPEEALRLAKLGRVALPDHPLQFYNLASAYQVLAAGTEDLSEQGELLEPAIEAFDEAILAFDEASEKDDLFSWALADAGIAHAQLGDLYQEIDKKGSDLYQELDRTGEARNSYRQAEELLERARRLDPNDAKIKGALRQVQRRLAPLR